MMFMMTPPTTTTPICAPNIIIAHCYYLVFVVDVDVDVGVGVGVCVSLGQVRTGVGMEE
jgi:hypothetical protein